MANTILVIGATGTNGAALINALGDRDVRIRAFVRDLETAKTRLPKVHEFVEGDLADRESLARAFDGVHKVFMVTAVVPNVVELFGNAYAAASKAGVAHFVKLSGLGATVHSASEVIRQHGETDDTLRASGVPFTILRPNSFHQNMLRQAQGIAGTGRFYLALGDAAQSTIDVRDIADIAVNVLMSDEHVGCSYDLTGPESLTFHDVARIIGEIRGQLVTYVPISRDAVEDAMKGQGMPAWSARAVAEIQELFATGDYADVLPDAGELLGRSMRTFGEFVRDYRTAFAASPPGAGS